MLLFRIKKPPHGPAGPARELSGNRGHPSAALASLGLQTDLWEVQNRYWTNRESLGRGTAELERMLGFRA